MQGLIDTWVDVQSWILETAVHPLLFRFGYMTFFEDAPFVVETLMLGVVQIAVLRRRTEHDHRGPGCVRCGPELAADSESVHVRQHDVQENDVRLEACGQAQGGFA